MINCGKKWINWHYIYIIYLYLMELKIVNVIKERLELRV